jgi:hypothetical protein
VDAHPLGKGTTVGVAQLGRDDAGRQPGEGAAGVVGIDWRAPFGAERQVQLDRAGWLTGSRVTPWLRRVNASARAASARVRVG